VRAPLCVRAAFYSQVDGRRTVVHLLNEVSTSVNRALPENIQPQPEETLPVLDVTVSQPEGRDSLPVAGPPFAAAKAHRRRRREDAPQTGRLHDR